MKLSKYYFSKVDAEFKIMFVFCDLNITLYSFIPNILRGIRLHNYVIYIVCNYVCLWFGHVERMCEYRMASRVLMAEVCGGRVRGRPRLGWMDGVKVALGNR